MRSTQALLLPERTLPRGQLLKWIGSKFRSAREIAAYFPEKFNVYFEPFVGGGALLGTLSPHEAVAGDTIPSLIGLWRLVQAAPERVLAHYTRTWEAYTEERDQVYRQVRDRYNLSPNPLDLLFLSRACYGGVVRFTRRGTMSTPIGAHVAIPPKELERRIWDWQTRIVNTRFECAPFSGTLRQARKSDLVYCDPPYVHAQSILYGAQDFSLAALWEEIAAAADRGAYIALSLDGYKRSGELSLELAIPKRLFRREVVIHRGGSMLKRFQRKDGNVSDHHVGDRLLLTW